MFSKKLEYGYVILKLLKTSNKNNMISGKDLITESKIPFNMGLGILTELSRGGLIKSIKGKNGGFYREPEKEITLFDLFQVLENQGNKNNFFFSEDFQREVVHIGLMVMKEMANIKI